MRTCNIRGVPAWAGANAPAVVLEARLWRDGQAGAARAASDPGNASFNGSAEQ